MVRTQVQKRWSSDQLITGIEAGPWLRLLQRNGYQVDSTYLHRAAWIGGLSLVASALGAVESATHSRALASQALDPAPVFVIGHWRSGTTHLHNLLGRLPGYTYPTVFQCIFPGSFLTSGSFLPALTAPFMEETRTYDNVKHGWYEAAEDEIALAKLTGLSPYIAFMFPDQASDYEPYVDFQTCSVQERTAWKQALTGFVRKIMVATGGQRVVVKSCTHTARIPLILEAFPRARFIHIHRHPYEVYRSTLHMRSHTDWENFFHLPERPVQELRREQTLALGQRLLERVVEDRHLIPEGQYMELRYEDLCGQEVAQVRALYEGLDLGDWAAARPVLERYVAGLGDYQRNRLELGAAAKRQVYTRWRVAFDAFGYTP